MTLQPQITDNTSPINTLALATRPSSSPNPTHPILCNLIPLKTVPSSLHHYVISFDPEPKRIYFSSVFQQFVRKDKEDCPDTSIFNIPHAFDNISILVSTSPLFCHSNLQKSFEIQKRGGSKQVMTVSYKNTYEMTDLLSPTSFNENYSVKLQLLEVCLCFYQQKSFFSFSKSCFCDSDLLKLNKGLEVWTGISQSLKMSRIGLLNNVDVSFVTFYENINVVDLLKKILSNNSGRGGNNNNNSYDRRGGGGYDGRRNNDNDRRGNDNERRGNDRKGYDSRDDRRGGRDNERRGNDYDRRSNDNDRRGGGNRRSNTEYMNNENIDSKNITISSKDTKITPENNENINSENNENNCKISPENNNSENKQIYCKNNPEIYSEINSKNNSKINTPENNSKNNSEINTQSNIKEIKITPENNSENNSKNNQIYIKEDCENNEINSENNDCIASDSLARLSEFRVQIPGGYDNRRQTSDKRQGSYDNRRERYDNKQQPEDLDTLLKTTNKNVSAELSSLLKKLKLVVTHIPGKEFTIQCDSVSTQPANDLFFDHLNVESGETTKTSVSEYFASKYQPLKYPNLPCVIRKRKGHPDCYFPLEVLRIAPRQRYLKKLDDSQVSLMRKVSAKFPIQRFETLKKKIDELKIKNNEVLSLFNVSYDSNTDLVQTKGYVLDPPVLKYGNCSGSKRSPNVVPKKGSWDLRDLQGIKNITINKWAIAFIATPRLDNNTVQRNMDTFIDVASKFGLKMNSKFDILRLVSLEEYSDLIKKNNYQFLMFVLPDKKFDFYKEIKWRSETIGLKLVTQCVILNNFSKFNDPSFCSNIMIKVNAKMKGINWKLETRKNDKSTIIFGADVTHPGMGDLTSPSIVAVSCSLDGDLTQFSTQILIQERRVEIINKLGEIIKISLRKYNQVNKTKPTKIIFFRDGVGESQFMEIFNKEIKQIKSACQDLDKNYNPEINYIVCQKRHSIRFQSLDTKHEPSHKLPAGNVIPGTVVDSIGHPLFFDFYLVSHHALQGTARPIRYHILTNESKHSAEEWYRMINDMCYLYPRATKAVSVVPPIYYAHLAAARAKCYLVGHEEEKFRAPDSGLMDQLYYI